MAIGTVAIHTTIKPIIPIKSTNQIGIQKTMAGNLEIGTDKSALAMY